MVATEHQTGMFLQAALEIVVLQEVMVIHLHPLVVDMEIQEIMVEAAEILQLHHVL